MDTPPPWTHHDERTLLDCRIFRVDEAHARAPATGTEHRIYRLRAPDWINVIALTPEDEVVMVTQFRHGARAITLEIPGGMVDPGETPAAAAARELREETGHAADTWLRLGAVNPNPALFDNACHTYLARGARRVGPVANEGGEDTRVVRVPLDEVAERMRDGTIDHALVVAAFHAYALHEALGE